MSSHHEGAREHGHCSSIRPWRWIAAAGILGVAAGAAAFGAGTLLPEEGTVARGVRVAGTPVEPGARPRDAAEERARALLERRITVRWEGQSALDASLAELGATVDVEPIARRLEAVGRDGDLLARIDDALEARRGNIDVPVHPVIPVETLAARLERFKDERDSAPRPARLNPVTRAATPHTPGRYVDIHAAVAAIDRAVARGESAIDLPVLEIAPRASTDAVASIDVSQVVASFETRFGYRGGQAGRAQNVARAAEGVDGVVLMPGDVVSFNANVGPRSVENGFTTAPEIYKGEMREGIGGGTCQVASTLHAAAFLAGLEVVERINHSRPSGYIRMGLDATVVYPTVDLKLRNPYDFPIVLHARIDKGLLTFELLGKARPVTVDVGTETVGVAAFKRKVEEDPGLPEGKVVQKQRGIRGFTIKKRRTIHLAGGQKRVEVTTDVYPPTFEIYRVRPGTDVDAVLPPLPGADGEETAAPAQVAATASAAEASGRN